MKDTSDLPLITESVLTLWGAYPDVKARHIQLCQNGATLTESIDMLVKDGHDDWAYWLFLKARDYCFSEAETEPGYYNSGCFCTTRQDMILVFNKPSTRSEWEASYKPHFLSINPTLWVDEQDISDEDKKDVFFEITGINVDED